MTTIPQGTPEGCIRTGNSAPDGYTLCERTNCITDRAGASQKFFAVGYDFGLKTS